MIKFNIHNIRNTETGVTVRVMYNKTADREGRERIAVYAKDYGCQLSKIFAAVTNDTDPMTDYFESDKIAFYRGDEHFEAALAAAERASEKDRKRWEKKYGKAA